MQGHLFKSTNENNYYLIDNVGAYNYIVIEFQTFKSLFISIETVQSSMINIEFNVENIKKLLNSYEIFERFINYDYLGTKNHIIYNNRMYYIHNWIDVFNFANKIM